MSKAAFFLADGFEEVEAIAPIDILRRGGVEVTTVSINGSLTVHGSHNIDVTADVLFEDFDADDQDMLILPGGGLGTKNLKAHTELHKLLKDFYGKDRYLAAICAAPTVFGMLGFLEGKKATCYGGMEEGLTGADVSCDPVVRDGKIITSRGMGTAILFGLELLSVFTDRETADKMAETIMMP